MLIELLKSRYISVRYRDDIANIKSKMKQCDLVPLTQGQISDINAFYQNGPQKKYAEKPEPGEQISFPVFHGHL